MRCRRAVFQIMRQVRGVPVEAEELLERDGREWRRIGEEELDERGRIAAPGSTTKAGAL